MHIYNLYVYTYIQEIINLRYLIDKTLEIEIYQSQKRITHGKESLIYFPGANSSSVQFFGTIHEGLCRTLAGATRSILSRNLIPAASPRRTREMLARP